MAKKKTIKDLFKMKEQGEKAVWVVMYDAIMAGYAEEVGMDMILCGDSMGMAVYGQGGTTSVTMDMSIAHCRAVRSGAPNTYLIGDMPFGSYHESVADTVHNAVRFIKEADVDAIKLEGGVAVADKIEALTKCGIVVFGHVGLTPQSSAAMGGFKAQGRTTDSAKAVIEDAIAVYKAGAKTVLLEGVPEEVCEFVHKILPIPVYSIGAGGINDGHVLLACDLLGMYKTFTPKFVKKYADIASVATEALATFVKEVKDGTFPEEVHNYKISGDKSEFEALFNEMEKGFTL